MSSEYESNELIRPNDDVVDFEPLQGNVIIKEPTFFDKLCKVIFPADVKDVGNFIVWKVLMPNAKWFLLKSINDIFDNDTPNYSSTISPRRKTISSNGSWLSENVSWGDTSDLPKPVEASNLDEVGNFCYSTKEDAWTVRERLYGIAKSYKVASVFDQCRASRHIDPITGEPVEIEPKWNYNYVGWLANDIAKSTVKRYGVGYIITLPEAYDIKKYKY